MATNNKAHTEIYRSPSKHLLIKHNGHRSIPICLYSPKIFIFILMITCVTLFILLHIHFFLQTPQPSLLPSPSLPWSVMYQWQSSIFNTTHSPNNCTNELNSMVHKLRSSVTFLPLKDLRYANAASKATHGS
ncbi:hypothetical protein SESBI_40308 [Sesbania bispinosa]|nr:hypothetical protein SESBI_40308 [Sesbania bispinosa]